MADKRRRVKEKMQRPTTASRVGGMAEESTTRLLETSLAGTL